jgi:hypothetical protein
MAARWTGSSWSVMTIPGMGGSSVSLLQGLTCSGSGDCVAVGSAGSEALVEHWNGASWSRVPTPVPDGGSALMAVTCVRPSDCLAAGDSGGWSTVVLVERWDGRNWTIVGVPSA